MPDVLTVEFCGECYTVGCDTPFIIGRSGRLAIDDNPHLHRRFLQISNRDALWWLTNIGSQLSATLSDENGAVSARLGPGARLPIMSRRTFVWFTAGSTTYDFEIRLAAPVPAVDVDADQDEDDPTGPLTIARLGFTPDQKRLIVALSEPMLCHGLRGAGWIPTSPEAAARLGWPLTRFNRKLDNVCDKLSRAGVRGLHGDSGRMAMNRRARLVEYAITHHVVRVDDLAMLDSTAAGTSLGQVSR